MNRCSLWTAAAAAVLVMAACTKTQGPDYPIRDVPMASVRLTAGFWADRQATDASVTIRHEMKESERTGRIRNFELAAAALQGETGGKLQSSYAFDDSDVYKVIEAAAYVLTLKPDPELENNLDVWIQKITAAQEPDGYLYTARTINPANLPRMSGPERWVNLEDSHELYNVGHLYEAAAAHFQATGKRTLLNVALKSADFIAETFGPGDKQIKRVPGHEEIEIGLVKLYRLTGKKKYLDLAKFFVDQRGNAAGHDLYGEYAQDHKPVLQQDEAVGHAVRAAYLYSGAADVAALTGDDASWPALEKIWEDVVTRKLYLTGGIGSAGGIEGFGPAYDLGNETGYAETCATIAFALWNHRMFRRTGEAKYMDLFERAAMNAFLSGYGLSGDLFFYPNPLASRGETQRTPWFNCACCPPNVARFIAEMGGFAYAAAQDRVYINLFAQGTADIETDKGIVTLSQTTDYPWSGNVKIEIKSDKPAEWTLMVRIPGWAQGRPLPGGLYVYEDGTAEPVVLRVNGEPVEFQAEKGFAPVRRTWASGDTVDLLLPMPVRLVRAAPEVKADAGRAAVERGPLVYAAEFADNGGTVTNLMLNTGAPLTAEHRADILGGLTVVSGKATAYRMESGREMSAEVPLTLIPYYAWAHRGKGEMAVWLAVEKDKVRPTPEPTLASMSTVTASDGAKGLAGLNNLFEPERSIDHATGYAHWWPKNGTAEWVQLTFPKPATVSEVSVYWFDDTGAGECRVPVSWKVFSLSRDQWIPVRTKDRYGVEKDAYNTVRFIPVRTEALKIELLLPENFSSGIQEIKVK
ncbi:MAG: glycoside hydrolase family 127 protein [Candidatus Aminicenantes bacterium]|nr:glycoside hydrolase family 127 protein [Candidatus Aminicenantes bacterium]